MPTVVIFMVDAPFPVQVVANTSTLALRCRLRGGGVHPIGWRHSNQLSSVRKDLSADRSPSVGSQSQDLGLANLERSAWRVSRPRPGMRTPRPLRWTGSGCHPGSRRHGAVAVRPHRRRSCTSCLPTKSTMICGSRNPTTTRSGCFFAHDHVAREQQADVGHRCDRLVCERWIAGTEDAVRRHVDAQLLLHRVLHVDVAQDAEAFGFQSGRASW